MGTFYYQATDGGVRGNTVIVVELYSGGVLVQSVPLSALAQTIQFPIGIGVSVVGGDVAFESAK